MNLTHLEKKELKQLLSECYRSRKLWGQVMFPDTYYRNFSPKIHDPIFNALEDPTKQFVNIIAPRGVGKTTLIAKNETSYNIVFQELNYIVYGSDSSTFAIEQMENLKMELEGNSRLIKLFGSFKSGKWSEKRWITDSGIMVLPRGAQQQIRGIKFGDYRPQLLLWDDLEDDEIVLNEDRLEEMHRWFFASVVKTVDRRKKRVIWKGQEIVVPGYKIVVLNTLRSHNSLSAKLMKNPKWHSIRVELCDKYFKSNWPEYMSDEEIQDEVEMHRSHDIMDVFYREYRGLPIPDDEKKFHEKFCIRFNCPEVYKEEREDEEDKVRKIKKHASQTMDYELYSMLHVINFVIVDPAKEDGPSHNDTSIMGFGYDTKFHRLYMRRSKFGKFTPDVTVEEAYKMCDEINAVALGVESTGSGKYITYPFLDYKILNHKIQRFIELKARSRSKVERALGILSWWREYRIWLHAHYSGPLEEDLYQYPKPARWDLIDCLSYVMDMLKEIGVYSMSPLNDGDRRDMVEKARSNLKRFRKEGKKTYNHKIAQIYI